MQAAQYWVAILHVVLFPPVVIAWLLIHRFIDTWRRWGIGRTYLLLGLVIIPCWVVLGALHEPIMSVRYGVSWPLIGGAVALEAVAWWVAVYRWQQAGGSVLTGHRELAATSDSPGELITGGIYSRIRHPRYVELGLHLAFVALFCNTLATWCLLVVLLPAGMVMIYFEERELHDRFGDAYDAYCRATPRFIPRMRPASRDS